MKIIIATCISCIFYIGGYAQSLHPIKDLGEGAVTVDMYGIPPETHVADTVTHFPAVGLFMRFHYFIKGTKVRRMNPVAGENEYSDTRKMKGNGGTMSSSMHMKWYSPEYLINMDSGKVYVFLKDHTKPAIAEANLVDYSLEYFYRMLMPDTPFLRQVPADSDYSTLVAGKLCFKGKAVFSKSGDEITFFYTKDTGAVSSPLNAYFGLCKADINIMQVVVPCNWTTREGKITTAHVAYQVVDIDPHAQDEKLFSLPGQVPAVKGKAAEILLDAAARGK